MMQEGLTDEQVRDGLEFARMVANEKLWAAFERMLRRFNEDAIYKWEHDKSGDYSKKWLRGARETLADLTPAIIRMAEDAHTHIRAEREAEKVVRQRSEDGLGSGDLAIA